MVKFYYVTVCVNVCTEGLMKGNYNVVPVHAMKAHRGRRVIAPFILNLCTRRSRVVEIYILATSATLLPAPTEWKLGGPIASMDILEKRKISLPCRESNPGSSSQSPKYYKNQTSPSSHFSYVNISVCDIVTELFRESKFPH